MGIFLAFSLLTAFVAVLYWITREKVEQQETSSKLSMLTDLMKGLQFQSQVGEDKRGWLLNTIIVFTFLCVLQFGLYFMWPRWYTQHWRDGWLVFTEIAAGIGFAMRVRDPNAKPMRHFVGTTIVAIVLLVTIRNTFFPPSSDPATNAQTTHLTANFLDVKIEKTPCLENNGMKGLDSDKIRKDLRNYPALLAIACRESGLNHMDPENPSKVFLGKKDPRDKGFLQLNTHYHQPETVEKMVGCKNIEDYDCSLRYGIKLYETNGLNPWFPYGTENEKNREYRPITVFVVAGTEFGPRINIPKLTNTYRFDHQGKTVVVEAEDTSGNKKEYVSVDDDKTAPINIGTNIQWIRFKRGPDEKENVKVMITYTFQTP